jgi:hypothetical protein
LLDLRAPLIPLSAVLGLALGATAWLAAGHQDVMASTQDRLAALRPLRAGDASAGAAPILTGAPLFALSTGPNAVKDPAVLVLGLSRMPGRTAALVAIDGKPAAWLARGDSRDGVILREVGSNRATLDLPLGVKDLRIGEATLGSAPVGGATSNPPGLGPNASDMPPPGYRSPPPPASAPGFGG